MANNAENTVISPELYLKTLAELALKEVCVDAINATCNRDVVDQEQTTISLESKNFARQTPDEYKVYITYQLTGQQGEVNVLKIETTFCVIFGTTERVPDGFFEVFSDGNLTMTTMPYFREIVASTTSRMGLPVLTIPYNIFPGDASEPEQATTELVQNGSTTKKTRKKRTEP